MERKSRSINFVGPSLLNRGVKLGQATEARNSLSWQLTVHALPVQEAELLGQRLILCNSTVQNDPSSDFYYYCGKMSVRA